MKIATNTGKQNTRQTILHALRTSTQSKVEELAEIAEVSPVTVRHHLNALRADGLIEVNSVRRKVGRPYYVYSLSEAGQELFPRKYVRLANRLLDELKTTLPPEIITKLFNDVAENILADRKGEYEDLPFKKRLDYLVSMLSEEGFIVELEGDDGRYTLTEHGCPYQSVSQEHSEICDMDLALITNVLQIPVERHSCLQQGDDCCQFTFSK